MKDKCINGSEEPQDNMPLALDNCTGADEIAEKIQLGRKLPPEHDR